MKRLCSSVFVLVAVVFVATLSANLLFIGPLTAGASGLGTVNTILTIQNNPTETGCVAWNGSVDVFGPTACPPGIAGGDEKTGASQTQTRSIAELGLLNAASIRLVLNAVEPAADGITLTQLILRIHDAASGAVLFSGPLAAPVVFPTTNAGTGTAGFGFALDAPQAAAAQVAFSNRANRLSLSAALSDSAAGGNETLYIFNLPTEPVPALPRVFLLVLALGLAAVGYLHLRRPSRA